MGQKTGVNRLNVAVGVCYHFASFDLYSLKVAPLPIFSIVFDTEYSQTVR